MRELLVILPTPAGYDPEGDLDGEGIEPHGMQIGKVAYSYGIINTATSETLCRYNKESIGPSFVLYGEEYVLCQILK
jgi:hypothetical protein